MIYLSFDHSCAHYDGGYQEILLAKSHDIARLLHITSRSDPLSVDVCTTSRSISCSLHQVSRCDLWLTASPLDLCRRFSRRFLDIQTVASDNPHLLL